MAPVPYVEKLAKLRKDAADKKQEIAKKEAEVRDLTTETKDKDKYIEELAKKSANVDTEVAAYKKDHPSLKKQLEEMDSFQTGTEKAVAAKLTVKVRNEIGTQIDDYEKKVKIEKDTIAELDAKDDFTATADNAARQKEFEQSILWANLERMKADNKFETCKKVHEVLMELRNSISAKLRDLKALQEEIKRESPTNPKTAYFLLREFSTTLDSLKPGGGDELMDPDGFESKLTESLSALADGQDAQLGSASELTRRSSLKTRSEERLKALQQDRKSFLQEQIKALS